MYSLCTILLNGTKTVKVLTLRLVGGSFKKSLAAITHVYAMAVISVISRRWKGEHERLCAMKRRLGSGRISPPAGFEPVNP